MKTLRLYKFEVEILDDSGESDEKISRELSKAVQIYMEAIKCVVAFKEASDVQVKVDEFGRPILAEA
jgi:hypothetical protein